MTTIAMPQFGSLGNSRVPSAGTSTAAGYVQQEVFRIIRDAVRSATGEGRFGNPIADLLEAAEESRELARYGDVVPPTQGAINEAITLIESLPAWAPPPTPIMEHDGAIGLEWNVGAGRFFVLAVDGTGRAEYSAILGIQGEHYGTTNFTGALPVDAQPLLARLLKA